VPAIAAHPLPDAELIVDDFAERAALLVAFLVERQGAPGTVPRREHELGEWIAHWQKAQRHGWAEARHFVAGELGIIVRALNGPAAAARTRIDPLGHQQLCWLIAQCMGHDHRESPR
jgi:hypothetical protein